MKYLLILSIVFLTISSCDNNTKPQITANGDSLQVCDFGIQKEDFSKEQRDSSFTLFARGRKIKNPPPPPPPPAPVVYKPGVILLDFDGHTVTGTNWNTSGDLVCSPSGLSIDEQQVVLDSVASKYRIFNVIVTTLDSSYNAAPANKRIRLIFTQTYEWFGMSGGVAFIGSFTWGNNTPCFVFTSLLGYNSKKILEAGTHEVGHSLGLYHQSVYDSIPAYPGTRISEYNSGCCGFAPIMGLSYYQPMSQWITGWNASKQVQDDINKISLILPKR